MTPLCAGATSLKLEGRVDRTPGRDPVNDANSKAGWDIPNSFLGRLRLVGVPLEIDA